MDNSMDTQGQSASSATYDPEPLVSTLEQIGLWLKVATLGIVGGLSALTIVLIR